MSYFSSVITSYRALQRAPEPIRKKWQRGASVVAFALVIGGWILYLNASLAPERAAQAEHAQPSFFDTLRKGLDVFGSSLGDGWNVIKGTTESLWSSFGANLTNPTTLEFIREQVPQISNSFEPIPPQALPIR